MGNCQTAEMATAEVQHPGNGKVERIFREITANEVMSSNPGYYVALVVNSLKGTESSTVNHQFKLLRPTDILHFGRVYRLISFEDVIKECASKESAKLGKLLEESGVLKSEAERYKLKSSLYEPAEQEGARSRISRSADIRSVGRNHRFGGQWKPALQSIAEIGS
ncbi:uncharacterized protein LOC130820960 [Amaranthus tricolor]|uniref:uncharacterized protein LOC130820960 n=1 Tax=Amaranthus tricolor TaxID=29722 RepID=UPI00258F5F39|nr:uncharacterized protein LOC130820960 [Amaranthus tricolor]